MNKTLLHLCDAASCQCCIELLVFCSRLNVVGLTCLLCFDAVGWAAGRASGL